MGPKSTSAEARAPAPAASGMKVKGSFFLGRKTFVCAAYGEPRWRKIVADLAKADRIFASHILVTSLLPAESYVRFQETLVRELFGGDQLGYWIMGEKAGEWALTEGPYRPFAAGPDNLPRLVGNLPRIWEAYFTAGRLQAELEPGSGVVHVRIVDLPLRHVSLELSVMGFAAKALELCVRTSVRHERVTGVDGEGEVYYRFFV